MFAEDLPEYIQSYICIMKRIEWLLRESVIVDFVLAHVAKCLVGIAVVIERTMLLSAVTCEKFLLTAGTV